MHVINSCQISHNNWSSARRAGVTQFDLMLCAEQLPEGLEQAIMKMKVGEKAEIAIQPQYAFGAEASQQPKAVVPPQSTVVYTLELVDMEKVR